MRPVERQDQRLTIVFDLDGTLIDTAPDLVRATNHVLAHIRQQPISEEMLKKWVGFGARRMIVQGLNDIGVELPDSDVDRLLSDFLAYYEANIAIDSQPFPGAVAALDRLEAAGHSIAICTNKSEALAVKLLDALALSNRFAAITGRDTFSVCKPDPAHLTGTIERANGTPEAAIMIGDSITDINTARAAGVPVIGVSHGYSDIPMQALAPDVLLDHFDDLDCTLKYMTAVL